MINNYLIGSKENELSIRSQALAQIVQPILLKKEDPDKVVINFNKTDRILGTETWVFNQDGKIIASSAEHADCEGSSLESLDLKRLMSGELLLIKGQSAYFNETVIRAVAPVFNGQTFLGGVILYSPLSGVNRTTQEITKNYLLIAFLAITMALLLGYLISRYITLSLRKISKVAQSVSEGNFKEKVTIYSEDELGMLGESINRMIERLEKYENTRTEFIANVSHELRSPLTSIQGFIDALVDKQNHTIDEKQRYLYIIQKETHRLSKLVNVLLEISRFDANSITLNIEPFPVKVVIDRAVSSLEPKLSEKDLQVETIISENIPLCNGDEDRVEQIFHNLLDNAIRYSPCHSKIIITCRLSQEKISVEVSDFGQGIPAEDIENIWERFYKVDKSREGSKSGTGLGLAIVQEIVKKHGTTISVESSIDQGTTFTFALPIIYLNC